VFEYRKLCVKDAGKEKPMKGVIEMKIRMTWDQIKNRYPGKWVKLEQVEWESEDSPNIVSAVVTKAAKRRPSSQDMLDAAEGKYSIRHVQEPGVFHTGYVTV
jgi:hypothetical protein